jgi:Lon protease-like protein
MSELRLFLLNTPLLPGMELPLQVFEPRYHELISECRTNREPFGVALIREGVEVGGDAEPFAMGTTAEIQVVAPLAQGRLLVRTIGRRRFRIHELHHDRSYLWADVEYPVDETADVPESLAAETSERFAELLRLRAAAKMTYERSPEVPAAPGELADTIGAIAAGTAPGPALQRIVETLDVGRRLELANELLSGLLEVAHDQARTAVAAQWAAPERLN